MVVLYGDRILHGSLSHGSYAWKFCMGRRLRNKKSECVVNLSDSKHIRYMNTSRKTVNLSDITHKCNIVKHKIIDIGNKMR